MKNRVRLVSIILLLMVISSPYVSAEPAPSRLVSINLCTDELLLRLADREKIASISKYAAKPNSSPIYDEAKNIPKNRGEIEEVMFFSPDLVIGSAFTNHGTIEMLKRLKVRTVLLQVPSNFEDIYENIKILGKELGENERAERLIEEMKQELIKLKLDNSGKPLRAVFYQSTGNVPGLKTFQDSIFKQVGLKNLAEELGLVGHNRLQLEEIIFAKPDVLILTDMQGKQNKAGREVLFHPALEKGLVEAQVATLSSKYMSCGVPSSVEAVRLLREQIVIKETKRD